MQESTLIAYHHCHEDDHYASSPVMCRENDRSFRRLAVGVVVASCLAFLPHLTNATDSLIEQPFERLPAQAMFSAGLHAIAERSLTLLEPSELSLEGMRGLALLDPNLGVERSGAQIILEVGGTRWATYAVPANSDIDGWADLNVELILDARQVSPGISSETQEAIYQTVFDAMNSRLDIYSRYAGAKEAAEHRATRNGFGGIGIRYEETTNGLNVLDVVFGGPADRANIRTGDMITEIDGKSVLSMDDATINSRLRGSVASKVLLTVQRSDASSVVVSVYRALVVAPTVRLVSLETGIAHIAISGFNQHTVSNLAESIRTARRETSGALKGIILDLRNNPGGLLDQAVGTADLFMAHGVIVSAKGRHPRANQLYEATKGDLAEQFPTVVLINGETASSAEIVAAALQDSGRAIVVGSNSYGKGTIQTVIALPNTGELTLTWSRFHSPSGYALQGLGVLPSVCTSNGKSMAKILRSLRNDSAAITTAQARWHTLPNDTPQERQMLRARCPTTTENTAEFDETLARTLLSDHTLFTRVLKASRAGRQAATQAAARTKPSR